MARLRSRFWIRRDSITIYMGSGEYSCPAFDVNTFPMVYNIPDGGVLMLR